MASSSDKQYYLELTRHTLRAIRAAGSTVEFCRECPLDQKTAVDELFTALGSGTRLSAAVAISPQPMYWHRADGDEAVRHRHETDLRARLAALPHGLPQPFELIGCQADDGAAIDPKGRSPWLVGITQAPALAHEIAAAKQRGLELRWVEHATLAQVGGAAALLQPKPEERVVLWDLGLERSHLFAVSSRGLEAVVACEVGLDAIYGAVQAALGLKFRGAASRLFFNDGYDFSEAAPKIVAVVKEPLQKALGTLPRSGGRPSFAVLGLTDRQEWFLRELAGPADVVAWEPDVKGAMERWSLQLADGVTPTRGFLGLLHGLAGHRGQSSAWHPAWIQPETAIAPPAAAQAPAPIAAAPQPAVAPNDTQPKAAPATVSPGAEPATPAAPPARVASPQPKQPARAAAAASTSAVTAGKKSRHTGSTSAPVAVEMAAKGGESSKQAVAAVVESVAVIDAPPAPSPAPAPSLAKKPASSWRAETEERRTAPTSEDTPPPARKRGYGLYAAIAGGVLCAAVAAKFYFDAQAARELAERQKQEAARLAESAEARTRELEQRAQAEAARIRQEAEAAREAAVALARQQAEEQTRSQISAELEAERIAKSPGILIVTTTPIGAAVTIDGTPRGKSPLALNDIPPGSRLVAIALDGYEPVERAVEIRGTQTADLGMIELQRATGTLIVSSAPENLEFALERVGAIVAMPRTGRTPAQLDDLEPGQYVLTFTRPDWPDLTQNVTVTKRGTARANGRFVGGSVAIFSTPSGATVRQAGRVLGTTPLELADLAPQSVDYELGLAGYEPAAVSGEVKPGEKLRLDVPLLSVDRIATQNEVKVPPQPYETPAPRLGSIPANGPKQVNVSFTVWRDGTLRDVSASGTTDKDIARRCVEAVSKWKFRPGLGHDDRPLNVRVTLPIMIASEG